TPRYTTFPYTTLFRSEAVYREADEQGQRGIHYSAGAAAWRQIRRLPRSGSGPVHVRRPSKRLAGRPNSIACLAAACRCKGKRRRSEEHTSELQSRFDL